MIKDGKEVDEYCNEIESKVDVDFVICLSLALLCIIGFLVAISIIIYETWSRL